MTAQACTVACTSRSTLTDERVCAVTQEQTRGARDATLRRPVGNIAIEALTAGTASDGSWRTILAVHCRGRLYTASSQQPHRPRRVRGGRTEFDVNREAVHPAYRLRVLG